MKGSFINIDLPDLDKIIDLAIDEDLSLGDITTQSLKLESKLITSQITSKSKGILSGNKVAKRVFQKIDEKIVYEENINDGEELDNNTIVANITGNENTILAAERTALNFLQRMSGVATLTKSYVDIAKNISITDTRKTIPGWRNLDKYAVRCGGGYNHRRNLGDGVLIKDNHIAAAKNQGLTLQDIISRAKRNSPHTIKVEIEVDNFELLEKALETDVDIIMLDNMSDDHIIKSIKKINGSKIIEVSGNIDKNRLKVLDDISGIDIVSIGKLTHSANALDISLNFI
ncbi:MAG: carboxylating nicotinate-nucleotide diphosphorylase [Dehalococcoidia bacterium]|nr:nicotinate-nucleotide diphosphorylase (carboxylating) [Chloroflexota bacterium]RZP12824.1 MAG: carboxylating nicotinate-nucleotide diphosphorylase [Chloroflexota bacterium]